jgi:KDO2-lipid IV(A) lauroyltransferase
MVRLLGSLSLGAARALGFLAGSILRMVKGRAYRITIKNMKLCYPEIDSKMQRQFAHESLVETAKTFFEAFVVWRKSWVWLKSKIISIENEGLIKTELLKGKGLLILSPHIGNWEVTAPYLASIAPLTAMYKPFTLKAIDKLILDGRRKLNINFAPTNRKGVSLLLQALKKGEVVGMLPDQMPEKESGGAPAYFFNHLAMTMTLVHSLIQRTECRVLMVCALRVKGGFRLVVLPVDEKIYSEDLGESLEGMNRSIENCVLNAPTQYQWEYNRFRRYFSDQGIQS